MEQGSYSGTRSERAFGSKKEMDQEIHKILLTWNSKHSCKVTTWTDYTSNSSKSTQTFTKQNHTKQHLLPKPKSFPPFFSSQNLMWWTKWEFTSYTPKTKPLVMPLHCSICYAYPHSKIFVFLASWSPCCLVTIFIALFFSHLLLLCHFTISIISIVLTDVFWFKKKKLPSYQVREEDLACIWLVYLWCKLLGADSSNFL